MHLALKLNRPPKTKNKSVLLQPVTVFGEKVNEQKDVKKRKKQIYL